MASERCVRWEPVPGIQSACADISFQLDSRDQLTATMHFSHMHGQPKRDLSLRFAGVVALRWVQESFDVIHLPKPWPQVGSGAQPTWTFPLLQIQHSTWLAEHQSANSPAAEGRIHFALISLNDLVHILAFPDVECKWGDANSDT